VKTSAYAPGRVELLGNHTDYNEGFVLSAAIDLGVTISGSVTDTDRILLESGISDEPVEAHLSDLKRTGTWADYVLGVVDVFRRANLLVRGFSARIESNVPVGAGLSSSAAVEVATANLLTKLFDIDVDPLALAGLCRRAENEFVGVQCGVLDQISSVFGKADHAIFLDCRTESITLVPFPEDATLLIAESGVEHQLTGGEYNERRAQCFEAAKKFGVRALRDLSSVQLENSRELLSPVSYRRAAHVVGENERVLKAVDLLRAKDISAFGRLMYQSHESSRQNFENSTPELDQLVAIAAEQTGVFGARLTGGGFGGATITLVSREAAPSVADALKRKYRERTGIECQTYLCEVSDGAQ
jgi:galactokinase